MIATPEGKLSRYFYGIQYTLTDVRLSLVEGSAHKIGSPVDYVLLYCCPYDPLTGKYTVAIYRVLKLAGGLYGQGDARGYPPLRKAIAEYVGSDRGVHCHADQVIVTAGAQ